MKFDAKALLTALMTEPSLPKLTRNAKEGLKFIIERVNADEYEMLEHVAYALATAYWESGRTFQPVREKRANASRQAKLYELQSRYWHTGAYGRGLVQITWPENYCKFGMCSREEYDQALEPEKAYEIMSRGMKEGLFAKDRKTKKPYKLSTFIRPGHVDYRGARRIINGTDKADVVADIAKAMERALRASLITEKVEDSPAPVEDGFVKHSATPAPTEAQPEAKEDILDSVPNVSKGTLVKSGNVAKSVAQNIWARVGTALAGGEFLKLSIYVTLAIVAGIVIFHYRKQIIDFVKKLKGKVTE
jgi:type IV secretory pathway VirB2 component (pilin)